MKLAAPILYFTSILAFCDVGNPQLKTGHPFYPGELASSTFERLFAEQARQYQLVTGKPPRTAQDKALASWFWRNTHYAHGEEGAENLWGLGFTKGDLRTREYWTGLFAHGFGLCGTTHSQWTAEMEYLLGHGRGRGVGVTGHNAFEVFLQGGPYADGKWVLLDHDLSTVIYDSRGESLLSIREIAKDWKNLTRRELRNGWLPCGLHPGDGAVYQDFNTAEYLAGYASVPPIIRLKRGEVLRRYFEPGLDDGKTFVFWGRNYRAGGIPGPERSLTWVNQPEKMHGSAKGAPYRQGQARYGNAVYDYTPDFQSGDYREALVDQSSKHVTLEFYTPFIIAATPANDSDWGIYDPDSRNGLTLHGDAGCDISLSVDRGKSWIPCGPFKDGMDLTDHAKGYRQYFLRLHDAPQNLQSANLRIRTVCQANPALFPRLTDGETTVRFEASAHGVVSAGPTKAQGAAHVVDGAFDSPKVTLKVNTPRGEPIATLYASAHIASGNPPDPKIKYQIEASLDNGSTWQPVVRDWSIPRIGDEPRDFWSQSFCYGSLDFRQGKADSVLVRFRNDGGRKYLRAEAHLVYRTPSADATRVTFAWTGSNGEQQASHIFATGSAAWTFETGEAIKTRWVEMKAEPKNH